MIKLAFTNIAMYPWYWKYRATRQALYMQHTIVAVEQQYLLHSECHIVISGLSAPSSIFS